MKRQPDDRGIIIMCTCKKIGYQSIAADLRDAILCGDYVPGQKLPKQERIARDYGVNINTVRAAIRMLQAEGLVTPLRSHGTRVRDRNPVRLSVVRAPVTAPGSRPFKLACELRGWTGAVDVVSVSRLPADPIVAEALRVDPGSDVFCRVNRMRIVAPAAQVKTVQLQTRWIPRWLAEGTALEGSGRVTGGVYNELTELGHVPARVVESVFPRMPTRKEAQELGLRPGCPVTDVRSTVSTAEGTPVLHTHLVVTEHVCLVYSQEL